LNLNVDERRRSHSSENRGREEGRFRSFVACSEDDGVDVLEDGAVGESDGVGGGDGGDDGNGSWDENKNESVSRSRVETPNRLLFFQGERLTDLT